jgi:hypothetical protein
MATAMPPKTTGRITRTITSSISVKPLSSGVAPTSPLRPYRWRHNHRQWGCPLSNFNRLAPFSSSQKPETILRAGQSTLHGHYALPPRQALVIPTDPFSGPLVRPCRRPAHDGPPAGTPGWRSQPWIRSKSSVLASTGRALRTTSPRPHRGTGEPLHIAPEARSPSGTN